MLAPGANAPVPAEPLSFAVTYTPVPGVDFDVSAFLLGPNGKVRGDADMCFYGQTSTAGGAVQLSVADNGRAAFSLSLDRLDSGVEKVALAATLHENKAPFQSVQQLSITVTGGIEAMIPTQGMKETALILGEFYRRQGVWKFRCVAQGFIGGLGPLARHFGVDLTDAAPVSAPHTQPTPAAPPVARPSTISLSKVTLDKSRPSISLEKGSTGFGEIKINLNWNRRPKQTGGFLSGLMGRQSNGIDLDVGCLFEMQNGQLGVVQALGNAFGSFDRAPYIHLLGDDRTGDSADGEWLRINGQQWSQIKRVLVYSFIYEGVPNWQATDGVVTLHAPGQPPIEVRLGEEGGDLSCCAIALLENVGGTVKVSRQVRFFRHQGEMDRAFNWGLRWSAGTK